jgi:hypothetical protein
MISAVVWRPRRSVSTEDLRLTRNAEKMAQLSSDSVN